MTDSKTKYETAAVVSKTSGFKSRAWADYSDSDDDEPVPVVPAVQPKTWGKLPVLTVREPVSEPVPTVPEPVSEPVRLVKSNGIRTLMVKNLPRDTTPEKLTNELRSIFKVFGPIKDVYVPINRDGTYAGTIKGFAKVQFISADHSAKAVTQSITIRKNKLVIEFAKEDR